MSSLAPDAHHSDPHTARAVAESFGREALRYDRTRPHYPEAMVEVILGTAPGAELLDVGIGTGISAQPFVTAGCHVLGIEPDQSMAELARGKGYDVEVAKFEDWHPRGRTFDGVIAGQSWHWVDPIAGATKAAEVLRPGGLLAVFWNVFVPPADLASAFADVYRMAIPELPFPSGPLTGFEGYSRIFAKAQDGIRRTGVFSEARQRRFDWHRNYSKAAWLDQVPTFGGHSLVPQDQMERLLQGLGSEIDAVGDHFTMGYAAVVVLANLAG